jgi:hypothetical protein
LETIQVTGDLTMEIAEGITAGESQNQPWGQ